MAFTIPQSRFTAAKIQGWHRHPAALSLLRRLSPTGRVRGGAGAAGAPRAAGRPVHRLPHHARQDGGPVVRAEVYHEGHAD